MIGIIVPPLPEPHPEFDQPVHGATPVVPAPPGAMPPAPPPPPGADAGADTVFAMGTGAYEPVSNAFIADEMVHLGHEFDVPGIVDPVFLRRRFWFGLKVTRVDDPTVTCSVRSRTWGPEAATMDRIGRLTLL